MSLDCLPLLQVHFAGMEPLNSVETIDTFKCQFCQGEIYLLLNNAFNDS